MLQINRTPDVVIGPPEAPYMERWWIAKNGNHDVYLHKISRSDDERALHDHRADNKSLVLFGEYTEIYAPERNHGYDLERPESRVLKAGDEVFRKAEQPHRLVLHAGPVWTLWRKFGDRRDWGFWPKEDGEFVWMQWEAYIAKYGEKQFRENDD